jgi:hypothetical protein
VTLSALKNLLRNSLVLVFALLIAGCAFSQPADTVVVYEYKYVTDTVWVEPAFKRDSIAFEHLHPIDQATLVLDTTTLRANLIIFSEQRTATIPINNIILTENNQKLKSMKKITFLGMTLLAVSSSAFSMSNNEKSIGIHLRANSVFQHLIYQYFGDLSQYGRLWEPTSILEVTPSLGIKRNIPLNRSLTLSPRISYLQLYGLANNFAIGAKGEGVDHKEKIIFAQNADQLLKEEGCEIIQKLYSESPSSKFHFLSTDLLINYYCLDGEKIDGRIYGGLRVDCLLIQTQDSSITIPINTNYRNLIFNYVGGFGLDFKKDIYLEFEYAHNINRFVNTSSFKVYYSTLSLNLGYYIFRIK